MGSDDLTAPIRTASGAHPDLDTAQATFSRKPVVEKFIAPQGELSAREEALILRWNELAPTQAERCKASGRYEVEVELQTQLLEEFPKNFGPESLHLDFAAGSGSSTSLIRPKCKVVALDISDAMINVAANIAESQYTRAIQFAVAGQLELWDMQPNPIERESVDSIICHGAFQSILARGVSKGEFDTQAAEIIFQRAFALLKPGGVFSTEFLTPPKDGDLNPMTTVIDPIKFTQLLEKAGFVIATNEEKFSYTHPTAGDLYSQWIVAVKK